MTKVPFTVVANRGLVMLDEAGEQLTGYMRITCMHRKSNIKDGGACGACYARLWVALCLIQKEPHMAARIAEEVFEKQRAESAALRLTGENGHIVTGEDGQQIRVTDKNGKATAE